MAIQETTSVETPEISSSLRRKDISLWILPTAVPQDVEQVVGLPWMNIWNAAPSVQVEKMWEGVHPDRSVLKVSRPDQDKSRFRFSEFVRVYDIAAKEGCSRRESRFVDQLKDRVEDITGLLCFVGAIDEYIDDVLLAKELSPNATVLLLQGKYLDELVHANDTFLLWSDEISTFSTSAFEILSAGLNENVIDAKDAYGLLLDEYLLEDISEHWTVLSRRLATPPAKLTQEDFDSFLNGDAAWAAYSSGVPYRRNNGLHISRDGRRKQGLDLIEEILKKATALEHANLNPNEQLEHFVAFCEAGSGCTTKLRQAAMELAHRGFPTLITKPHSRGYGGRSLEKFIIDVQDKWLANRSGKGTGAGMIPVCILIDSDAEAASGEKGLPRALQALGRKILLVRFIEKSQDEIDRAVGVYALPAEVSVDELVAMGSHLRGSAEKYGLAKLPSNEEWAAFHEGIRRLTRYGASMPRGSVFETPPLFLIGIYPFVKERISDQNSLEQYYYRKWDEIEDENAKEIVRIIATAGVYGLSLPFNTLRRHPKVDILKLQKLDKKNDRKVDIFIKWNLNGFLSEDWYLHMRHGAIAVLLSRVIDPSEGNFPYSAIVPVLKNLSTKEEDIWLADAIAYRLGRQFKRHASHFSLETDTSSQRAARAIFNAIPEDVKQSSRTVLHHQGRYHLHVLRACNDAINDPRQTTLDPEVVFDIALKEFDNATKYLKMAADIHGEGFEPITNVFNTLATSYFVLAETLKKKKPDIEREAFNEALEYEDRAIKTDPANGHALYQYIQVITKRVGLQVDSVERQVEQLSRAELRLLELIKLHEERRWRNIDPVEAEIQIGTLIQNHLSAVRSTLASASVASSSFEPKSPEAKIFLEIRNLVGDRRLEAAFRDAALQGSLRDLRTDLLKVASGNSRTDLYLYRLFLSDPIGRLEFDTRLSLLERIRRNDPEQFTPFLHDEAALYCQLDKLDVGERKLKELRELRRHDLTQWYWLNEKALLSNTVGNGAREITLEVSDPVGGWAFIRNTEVRVKYQPYQFGQLEKRHVFRAFIRFTLNGLQAVTKEIMKHDLKEMGLI